MAMFEVRVGNIVGKKITGKVVALAVVLGLACLAVGPAGPLLADDWTQFRGPGGNAVSHDKNPPTTWDEKNNIVWELDLPGPGASSPVVSAGRIFLTCYSGYGVSGENPGEQEALLRHLVCVDRQSGKLLWSRQTEPVLPEDRYRGFIQEHGYASSTPVVDGERVYVFYGKTGVLAYDLQGKKLWRTSVGTGSAIRGWGSASSLILYKDTVIVNASAESEAIVALDKKTGQEVWNSPAEALQGTWGTPVLVDIGDGQFDLVVSVPGEIWGLDPSNGNLLWFAEGIQGNAICNSVIAHDGVVYAVGGRSGGAVAVRAGGEGDVSKSHVLWTADVGSYVTSPLLYQGRIYWVSDRGLAYCLDAGDGETVYQKRVSGRYYASTVAAGGQLYALDRDGGTHVLATGAEFEELAENSLNADGSTFNATPAVSDGQIFIRSNKRLYCIGLAD